MLRRGEESCVQMGKVGEHGVNLRRAEALSNIVSRVAVGEMDCASHRKPSTMCQELHHDIRFGLFVWQLGLPARRSDAS